jgi:hypothetical protein
MKKVSGGALRSLPVSSLHESYFLSKNHRFGINLNIAIGL